LKSIRKSDLKTENIPDVRNLSLRKAIGKLTAGGFSVEISGSGIVVDQIPKPGSDFTYGRKIILICKNEL